MPLLLSCLSAIGLVSALLGDDVWDALSWLALSVPIVVIVWHVGSARRHSHTP